MTAAPKDPANWLAYAYVAVKADDAQANNRWDLVTQGAAAAYAAYQRAGARTPRPRRWRCSPIFLRGTALARRARRLQGLARPARQSIDVRKTYEAMRAQYGFRILDYKVDNESTDPARLFQFLRAAGAQDRFRPLCRGVGRLQHRDLE